MPGKQRCPLPVRRLDELGEAGRQRVAGHHRSPQISVILRTGIPGEDRPTGHIGAVTGNRVSPQAGALIHVGRTRSNGVIEEPSIVSRLEGEIALPLHKSAQIPRFHLAADVLPRTDAVEEGIGLVGDIRDLVLLVGR